MLQVQTAFNQLIMNYLSPVHLLVDGGLFLYTFACKGGVSVDENGMLFNEDDLLDDDLFFLEEDDEDV